MFRSPLDSLQHHGGLSVSTPTPKWGLYDACRDHGMAFVSSPVRHMCRLFHARLSPGSPLCSARVGLHRFL